MALHSLTKSGIFFAVGDISQVKGTQKIADMGRLTSTNPLIGWGLAIGVAAIAGLPRRHLYQRVPDSERHPGKAASSRASSKAEKARIAQPVWLRLSSKIEK